MNRYNNNIHMLIKQMKSSDWDVYGHCEEHMEMWFSAHANCEVCYGYANINVECKKTRCASKNIQRAHVKRSQDTK